MTMVLSVGEVRMKEMAAGEFKARCLAIMDQVRESGEPVLITKHGKPVARLVSAREIDRARVNEAFEKLKALRKGTALGGISWKALRDEGRP